MSPYPLKLFIFLVSVTISSVNADVSHTAGSDSIAWLKTGMPQALQQAARQNKPLFVYWGAVWCPPCNVVKSTIFTDPRFIQATRDYLPVYLDGDTEEAQKWGEKLKVMGYPTLMILSPEGKETLRLSPSNPVIDLVNTMNYAKNVWNPVSDILQQTIEADQPEINKINSLAMYSWSQDQQVIDHKKDYSEKLLKLEKKLGSAQFQIQQSIIFLTALNLKLDSLDAKHDLSDLQQQQFKHRVLAILDNPRLFKANILTLAYEAENIVSKLTRGTKDSPSADRIDLIASFQQKMRQYRAMKNIPYDHYYATFNPGIDFHESFKTSLSDKDKQQLVDYTTTKFSHTTDYKSREAMLSDASYLLFKYGLKSQAKELLNTEIKRAKSPWYIMSTLAYLAKQDEKNDDALGWYKKAFQTAKGPATKLQWYATYIRNLIKMKPKETTAIKSSTEKLLFKYTAMTDSYMGRNGRVLQSIKKSASNWAKENNQLNWINEVKNRGSQICSSSNNSIYKSGCEKFYSDFRV